MNNKAYQEAKSEFWNCIRMAPFTVCLSLFFAFTEWLPAMGGAAPSCRKSFLTSWPRNFRLFSLKTNSPGRPCGSCPLR